jgi:hypothetical protein
VKSEAFIASPLLTLERRPHESHRNVGQVFAALYFVVGEFRGCGLGAFEG